MNSYKSKSSQIWKEDDIKVFLFYNNPVLSYLSLFESFAYLAINDYLCSLKYIQLHFFTFNSLSLPNYLHTVLGSLGRTTIFIPYKHIV